MSFREIGFGTDEYRAECDLRDEVLRRPLGLSLNDEDLRAEKGQIHFGLFAADGKLAGCVVAVPLSPTEARIRQMAVDPAHQKRGLGRDLMEALEKNLQARGFQRFSLDARVSAVGFYEKLGYTAVGEEFIEVTVPHVRMVRTP